jgi:hypothetical protein
MKRWPNLRAGHAQAAAGWFIMSTAWSMLWWCHQWWLSCWSEGAAGKSVKTQGVRLLYVTQQLDARKTHAVAAGAGAGAAALINTRGNVDHASMQQPATHFVRSHTDSRKQAVLTARAVMAKP